MGIFRNFFGKSASLTERQTNDSSWAGFVRQNTSNKVLISLAEESESALNSKNYELASMKAGEGLTIADQKRDNMGYNCFHEFMGIILIEICLVDIKKAYELGMKHKAREFTEKCLMYADKSGASSQKYITLLKLRDIIGANDPVIASKIQDQIAELTIKGLMK